MHDAWSHFYINTRDGSLPAGLLDPRPRVWNLEGVWLFLISMYIVIPVWLTVKLSSLQLRS